MFIIIISNVSRPIGILWSGSREGKNAATHSREGFGVVVCYIFYSIEHFEMILDTTLWK